MLTTSVDGLWALQVLTGIEVLAPELGLRSILPSAEPKHLALSHPVAAELRNTGVLDELDQVDAAVVEWLTVLSRRDIALFMQVQIPGDDEPARVLLARFAQWWVVIERSADVVRISGAGTSTSEGAADSIVRAEIERVCGVNTPARFRPVTLDENALRERVTSPETLRKFLADQRLDGDQIQLVMLAADSRRSAQASIVAIQSGVDTGGSMRTHVEQSAVTIIDTPEGRIVVEHVPSAGRRWMVVAPGTASNVVSAVSHLMRRLPANQEWFSYRKVV